MEHLNKPYKIPPELEPLAEEARKYGSVEEFERKSSILFHRGIDIGVGEEGNYYSTNREFARQFSRTGSDEEIKSIILPEDKILDLRVYNKELPFCLDEQKIDEAKLITKKKGYSAFLVDEGKNQPNSIFVINKKSIISAKSFWQTAQKEKQEHLT